jgi:hypothetical protein
MLATILLTSQARSVNEVNGLPFGTSCTMNKETRATFYASPINIQLFKDNSQRRSRAPMESLPGSIEMVRTSDRKGQS